MTRTPDVAPDQLIQSSWGNEIRNRSNQVFANYAEVKSGWTTPPEGATAVTLDDGRRYTRWSSRWYWQGIVLPGTPPGTVTTDANGIFNLVPTVAGVNLDVITGGILELGYAADMTAYAWGTSRYSAGVLSGRLFKTTATGSGTVAVAVNTVVSTAAAFVTGYRN